MKAFDSEAVYLPSEKPVATQLTSAMRTLSSELQSIQALSHELKDREEFLRLSHERVAQQQLLVNQECQAFQQIRKHLPTQIDETLVRAQHLFLTISQLGSKLCSIQIDTFSKYLRKTQKSLDDFQRSRVCNQITDKLSMDLDLYQKELDISTEFKLYFDALLAYDCNPLKHQACIV